MKCNILYTSDSNYFYHMFTSIYSLLKNNRHLDLTIHVIEAGFTKEQMEQLELLFETYGNATLKVYSIDRLKSIMDKYSVPKWRGTDIANARLFAHEIIDVKRLLYIDSDTIVDKPLYDLFRKDIQNPVSATKEIRIPNRYKDKLSKYHNSGVLLFDYDLWEQYDCMKLLYDSLKTTDQPLLFPDQDLLNISLNELIATLDLRYNMLPNIYNLAKHPLISKKYIENHSNFYSMDELQIAADGPYIYHLLEYITVRPWVKNSIYPFNEVYNKYRHLDLEEVSGNMLTNLVINCKLVPLLSIIFQTTIKENEEVKQMIKKLLNESRTK